MIIKIQEKSDAAVKAIKATEEVVIEQDLAVSSSQETASASEEVTSSTKEISIAMDRFTKYTDELQLLAVKLDSELERFKIN